MSEITLDAIEQMLETKLAATENRIIKRIDESQEELARMVSSGFDEMRDRLDVTERLQIVERKFQRLEEALHIKL